MTTPGKIARFIGPNVELGLYSDRGYPTLKVTFTDAEVRMLRQVGVNWHYFELPIGKTREFLETPDGVTNWTEVLKWRYKIREERTGQDKYCTAETKVLVVLITEASGEFVFYLKAEVLRLRRDDGSKFVVEIKRRCPSIKEACSEPAKQDVAIDAYNLASKAMQHDYPMVVDGMKQVLEMFNNLLEVETVVYKEDEKTEERKTSVVRLPRDPEEMKMLTAICGEMFTALQKIDVIDGRVARIEYMKGIQGGVAEFRKELEAKDDEAKKRESQAAKYARAEAQRERARAARANNLSDNGAQASEPAQVAATQDTAQVVNNDSQAAPTATEAPKQAQIRTAAPKPPVTTATLATAPKAKSFKDLAKKKGGNNGVARPQQTLAEQLAAKGLVPAPTPQPAAPPAETPEAAPAAAETKLPEEPVTETTPPPADPTVATES
ncbi:MAG: hypothetical protein QY323_04020 [Patescibacteria group bacterium]|nr:MAG: hypothetical protein QY323_04020 [Patescibacteria group bacterium]